MFLMMMQVLDSIKDNITEGVLLPKIEEICKSEQYTRWKALDDRRIGEREQIAKRDHQNNERHRVEKRNGN